MLHSESVLITISVGLSIAKVRNVGKGLPRLLDNRSSFSTAGDLGIQYMETRSKVDPRKINGVVCCNKQGRWRRHDVSG